MTRTTKMGRPLGSKNKKTKAPKKTGRKPGRGNYARKTTKLSGKNPFTVEKVDLVGNRGMVNSQEMSYFLETVQKLPVDKKTSTFISRTVAATQKDANAFYITAKRRLALIDEDYAITCRVIKDAKDNYQGMRVWRTN